MVSFKEDIIEKKIINLLKTQGFKAWHPKGSVPLDKDTNNEDALLDHFVECVEKNNNVSFDKIQKMNLKKKVESITNTGKITNVQNVYDFLHNQQVIKGKDDKENTVTIINWNKIEANIFEVSDQLWFNKKYGQTAYDSYQYRKDLFILVNGVPLISIEEKKYDKNLQPAFAQTIRYRESWVKQSTILNLCLFFVITNELSTMVFGATDSLGYNTWKENDDTQKNNRAIFFWLDEDNVRINNIYDFTKVFLDKAHILNYLYNYIKIDNEKKTVFYAKPHQFHANEKILEHFSTKWKEPAYIWHATASGKTFTMYLAWKNFVEKLNADFSIMLVDRVDLDTQTTTNFTIWNKGMMTTTEKITIRSKTQLIKAIIGDKKNIVVTIDIFNNLLKEYKNFDPVANKIPFIKDAKIAIMFDECHRSLFGEQFKNISNYFSNAALLGFTGTPIFENQSNDFNNITPRLFPTQLHVYGMAQALSDGIILPVDYENHDIFKVVDDKENTQKFDSEEKKKIWKTKKYYEKLVEHVVSKLDGKTDNYFYAMLAVSSIDAANLVYEIFKGKLNPQTNEYMYAKYPEVNVVADFSTTDNELLTDPSNDLFVAKCDKNAFKKRVIRDFASLTGELVNDDDQSMFSQLLIEHLRTDPRDEKNPIRIVIVVDKLLTGFDSDYVNTLFLDKPLKSFRLIQAISRTTRVCSESKKTTGFLLSYRTNKEDIEKAFGDYSGNKEHSITLLDTVANYKKRMEQIKNEVNEIRAIFSTPNDIDKLDQLDEIIKRNKTHEFRTHFKTLKGLIEIFIKYDNHKWEDLNITFKGYTDYLAKYNGLEPEVIRFDADDNGNYLSDFIFEIVNKGFIDSKKLWALIQKVKTQNDWINQSRPAIITIISDSVLQNLERELLLYLDKQMDKYKYNVTDITKFKEDFKSFLSTLDNNFEFLADEIKKEYKFDISKEVIRDIFSFYDTNPNDDDWIELLIKKTTFDNASKMYDFFFSAFKVFSDKSKEIKKIINQISHEI